MAICPKCNASVNDNNRRCLQCGRSLVNINKNSEPTNLDKSGFQKFIGSIYTDCLDWCSTHSPWPRLLVLVYIIWVISNHSISNSYNSLCDSINLGIHEMGHPLFSGFGNFLHSAGGTILQLTIPLVAVFMFYKQRDYFAITFAGMWISTNFFDISIYMADARALALNLVTIGGGGPPVPKEEMHDWHNILSTLGLLEWDTFIAGLVWFAGICLGWLSCFVGLWIVWKMIKAPQKTGH